MALGEWIGGGGGGGGGGVTLIVSIKAVVINLTCWHFVVVHRPKGPAMPSNLIKSMFQHFSKARVSKDALQAIEHG